MKKTTLWKYTVLIAALHCSSLASASTSILEASNRMSKRLGATINAGDPAPTLLGANINYNITDYLKGSVGYGSQSVLSGVDFNTGKTQTATASVFGLGVRGMLPGWNLTPTVGLHFASVSYDGDGITLNGFTESGSHVYTTLGFDWQLSGGFNLNAGYTLSFKSETGGSVYVGAGWYFDFFS